MLSVFWMTHNRIYANLKKITNSCLAIHIWLLAVAAFFPFCAHLLGKFPEQPLDAADLFWDRFCLFFRHSPAGRHGRKAKIVRSRGGSQRYQEAAQRFPEGMCYFNCLFYFLFILFPLREIILYADRGSELPGINCSFSLLTSPGQIAIILYLEPNGRPFSSRKTCWKKPLLKPGD